MAADKNIDLREVCRDILTAIGEDSSREGLRETPRRFEKAYEELTSGYNQTLEEVIGGAIFNENYSEMVVVKEIEFYSLCEHHMLPFFGRVHVGYVPQGRIIGLSKIARIVNMYARRLQVQERLTEQISSAIQQVLAPMGVACCIEASHMCMMMRGIQNQSSLMVTNSMRGVFLKNHATREEFLRIIGKK